MKKTALPALILSAGVALAQKRCDAPTPSVSCNTTEINAWASSECTPFHLFLARGSDEPYPGRLGNITRQICAGIGEKQCGFENVQYPAKSAAEGVEAWCKSAAAGAANGQAQMKAYSDKCPESKLMLLGFSQGGAVTQDMLGGGGGAVFNCTQVENPALDEEIGKKVVAAVTFGAVVRNRNTNYTIGNGKPYDGRRARTAAQLSALEKYSAVLLDYCHFGDPMCAVGSNPQDVDHHLNYFLQHNEEVIPWFVSMATTHHAALARDDASSTRSLSSATSAASPSATSPLATGSAVVSSSATSSHKPSSTPSSTSSANKQAVGALSQLTRLGYATALAGILAVLL